jgi:hypothetical protein
MGLIGKTLEPVDEDLARRFYNRSDTDSAINFYLNREPSFFEALSVEGYNSQVFSVIDQEKKEIAGAYVCSIKDCYINGKPETIAYFSSIKIDKDYRGGLILKKIITNLRSNMHSDPKFYFCSILENNHTANKIFQSGRSQLPVLIPLGKFKTLIFKARKSKYNFIPSIKITNASNVDIIDLVAFLGKEGLKKQLFPVYKTEHFTNTQSGLLKGVDLDKLYIALEGNKIVGSLAVWDQTVFRQWLFYGKNSFNLIRPLVNFHSWIKGIPAIPVRQKRMPYRYISLVCIEEDRKEVFESLIYYAINQEIASNNDTILVLGHPGKNPMYSGINFPALELKSNIFAFAWRENLEYLSSIDFDNYYIETAAL